MRKKIIIIGAVALGPKVASRLRRLDPHADITVIDRDSLISYGGCGIPYYLGGDISDLEELRSTAAHVVRDRKFFRECKGIDVRTRVEALRIDKLGKRVHVKELDSGERYWLSYDQLVLATGASAAIPSFPGANLPGIFTISNLHDAERIKELMAKGKVSSAAVVGAGPIGLELCEAFTDLWGVNTSLIEMEDQVLPTLLGKCIARIVAAELQRNGVRLMLATRVVQIFPGENGDGFLLETTGGNIGVDLVVFATGIRPNGELAAASGLAIGPSGGILVDNRMQTSEPGIYAGGDCVEVKNIISGESVSMALGSLANRQGRIIADNINGRNSHFWGSVSTFSLKVFDLGIGKAGLTYRQAKEMGFSPAYSSVAQKDHAHFYPGAEMMFASLVADTKSRKVLGIEAAGRNGMAVKSRVDSVAVLLSHAIEVQEVSSLETGYAPPYSSAMDIINNCGNVLENILDGRNIPVDAADFISLFTTGTVRVLDVRGEKEAKPLVEKYGERWLNVPQLELRSRVADIPLQEPLFLLCDTGARSYETQVFLTSIGQRETRNIQGGFAMLKAIDPEFCN